MDFFTLFSIKHPKHLINTAVGRWLRQHWLILLLSVSMLGAWPDLRATELERLALERTEEGLFLSSTLRLELAPAIENALERAVPIYFLVQADVLKMRWYWTDKKSATANRTYRLAYQPLTRRWRVSMSSGVGPATGLQYALHQNFETLNDAVASIGRVANWKIADAEHLENDSNYYLNYQFKLDLALLPRPFQLGMTTQPEWHIDLRRTLPMPPLTPATSAAVDSGLPNMDEKRP